MRKLRVGILGATGLVGRQLVQLLSDHPWFEVVALTGSPRTVGRRYRDAMPNTPAGLVQDAVGHLLIKDTKPTIECDLVFSALPAALAGSVESEFSEFGYPVVSCTRAHRLDIDVPLVVGDVNPEHLELIAAQQSYRLRGGFMVSAPNAVANAVGTLLRPLTALTQVERVSVVSLEALTGAGSPSPTALDMCDNIIPMIEDGDLEIELEPRKLLGTYTNDRFAYASFPISAHAARANVRYGHTVFLSLQLSQQLTLGDFTLAWDQFRSEAHELELPMCPEASLVLVKNVDRPQPQLDSLMYRGMAVAVGRVREGQPNEYRCAMVVNNLIRGSAGNAVLIAELLYRKGYLGSRS